MVTACSTAAVKVFTISGSAELHIYQHGIHGFGFNYYKFTTDDWLYDARDNYFEALERWLNKQ